MKIAELNPGDRIRLVMDPPKGSAITISSNPKETEMGQYLGHVVTVSKLHERCVSIREDGGKFAWTPMLIEGRA